MEKVLLVSSLLLLTVTLIKCVYTSTRTVSEIYLCITLLSLCNISIVLYLITSNQIIYVIHFYKTGGLSAYLFVASSFLYIQKSISKQGFRWNDIWYYLPALMYLIDLFPFFLQGANFKRELLSAELANHASAIPTHGFLLPAALHFFLQNLYGFILSIVLLIWIYRHVQKGGQIFYLENKQLIRWFYIWTSLLFLTCSLDLLSYFLGADFNLFEHWFLPPSILVNIIYPLSLLISPQILYGVKGYWNKDEYGNIHFNSNEPNSVQTASNFSFKSNIRNSFFKIQMGDSKEFKSKPSNTVSKDTGKTESELTLNKKLYYLEENAESMKARLDDFMLESSAYLDNSYSINQLAKDNGYSVKQLSSMLNNYCKISFKDYINTFRVKYFIDKYSSDPDAKKLTMEALAKECGFSNRYTFMHAFKKLINQTPSAYFEGIE